MGKMFPLFPKQRTELPVAYREIYTQHYLKNRSGSTKTTFLSQKLESWMHKKVSADMTEIRPDTGTLEIGAGTLNHLRYEKAAFYDIVEPFEDLYKNAKNLRSINNIYSDISQIDGSKKYDRIVSVATFEHITDLPAVVASSCLLLKEDGQLRIAIPNEGTWLWKLAYRLTTGIEFRRMYGLKYDVLMNYEHVNTADEIEEIIRFFYKNVKRKVFGIHKNTALYRFLECKEPDMKHVTLFSNSRL